MWEGEAYGASSSMTTDPMLPVNRFGEIVREKEPVAVLHHEDVSADQSVRLESGDQQAAQRLIQYFLRCPSSQARMIRLRPGGPTA